MAKLEAHEIGQAEYDDLPELNHSDLARGQWAIGDRPVTPAEGAASLRRNLGGRPRKSDRKVQVTLRLDPDVLAAFKADGDGWQTRINDALRKVAAQRGRSAA